MLKNLITTVITILIIFLLVQKELFAQQDDIVFEHYSVDQGMYETNITCIVQDNIGFMWFSTNSGIEKYDGYNFTAYKNNPDDTNSIDNAFANTLYKDNKGNIWIGNKRGFDLIDNSAETFTHFKPHPRELETKTNNHVNSICEDKKGKLWIGTLDGLNTFDKSSGNFHTILHDNNNPESICSNIINSIHKGKDGSLWFGTASGLDNYDYKSRKFTHYWNANFNGASTDYFVNTIFEDKSGIFWLGTKNGLVAFDPSNRTSVRYLQGKGNIVSSVCEDEYGTLWIGTMGSGLYSFDKRVLKFSHYIHDPEVHNSISSNVITSVYKERSGTIWIGTMDGGVNKINRVKQPFKKYPFDAVKKIVRGNNNKLWIGTANGYYIFNPENEKSIPYSFGTDELIEEEKSGDLWIGTLSKGIYKRDTKGHKTNFATSPGEEITRRILSMWQEPDGTTWIGTAAGGVYKINPNQTHLLKVAQNNGSIKDLYLDSFGMLWMATFEGGLICYDTKKNVIVKNYFPDSQNPNNTKSQTFLEIHEDKKGTLWFATDEGLGKYIRETDSLCYYNVKDGLPMDIVWSILEDDHNNLWLSTRKGISKFDPSTNKFQNYDVSYGLPENGLSNIYGCKTENGEMYFGYPGGIVRFHPDSIKINQFIPPVLITSVKKLEKSVPIENEIHFSYDENFLSFEFVALSYLSQERNQYAYKMEGIDTGWVYSGNRRFASYPNLEPGKYTFRIKGSNNDGVWNEVGASLAIIISPPWWKTWWAYTLYSMIFVFSLYGMRRYEINRLRLKDKIKMDESILIEKEETEKMKSSFFANISHEFRTPLTLILGPAEKIISGASDDIKKDANIIQRNSKRLLQLINQLLDLSKLESGKLKLEASKGNIVSFVKGVALSFESLAESKNITLKLLSENEFLELYFDRDKMMKILTNLLSNAFKFTPEEGMITVSINDRSAELFSPSFKKQEIPDQVRNDKWKGSVEIKIRDTGIGIPQEEIANLFDRFYQVDNSFTKEHEGTGIGLALTKELVELHHGNIIVDSKIGEWTEFTIDFPLGRDHLNDHEILKEKNIQPDVILNPDDTGKKNITDAIISLENRKNSPSHFDKLSVTIENQSGEIETFEKTIILIVEDNYDMREFIKESLGKGYQIEEAVNGEQGVNKAEKIIPDIIISDMMMPKMDGSELTRILKNNEKTSHIPIILLTAKSGQENKIEGLQTGADDYLTKPFDTKELQIRIKNLITIRKKLQEKFSKLATLPQVTENKKLSSYDEKFMYKVMEVIEKHISEEDFSTEEFGEELGMSRMQVHRKLKALTGKSAIQFIRKVKLDKARKMIQEKNGNISEIAYSLGFGSPAYFTKCFKEEFGYPPSEVSD
jgi:signal transduction histidine kinase/ligand-binding sensor domain-containing protein/DNA-binding response OmpR family regulator